MLNYNNQGATGRKCNVAILMAQNNAVHQLYGLQLMQCFLQPTIDGDDVYEPVLWQSDFTKRAVCTQVEAIMNNGFDVLFVIGQALSVHVREFYRESDSEMPTVYLGTRDPEKLGLIDSVGRCGGQRMAIVADGMVPAELAEHIVRFKPYLSKICIPYCAQSSAGKTEENAEYIKAYLEHRGFEVCMQNISTPVEGLRFIKNTIASIDSLFIFEACALSPCIPEIASLCWDNKVIFFVGAGEEGIDLGASCAYGGNISLTAEKARQFLDNALKYNLRFGDLPVVRLEYKRDFIVNESMLVQFGIPLLFIEKLKKVAGVTVWRRWVGRPLI